MAHFAKINSQNIVEQVLVVPNEQEHRGEEYLNELGLEGRWVQTSYNANIRKEFAGVGFEYLETEDAFRQPAPYPSWLWDAKNWNWKAPVSKPTDGKRYKWDEDSLNWIEITVE